MNKRQLIVTRIAILTITLFVGGVLTWQFWWIPKQETILKEGMQGQGVEILQERLKALVFYKDPLKYGLAVNYILELENERGNFGRKTKEGIMVFQKANELPATGKVDKKTYRMLIREVSYNPKIIKHVVKEGENLYDIISRNGYGLDCWKVAEINESDPDLIFPGQTVYFIDWPGGTAAAFQLRGEDDSIESLVSKYEVSEEVIKEANCIVSDAELKKLERIYIPLRLSK